MTILEICDLSTSSAVLLPLAAMLAFAAFFTLVAAAKFGFEEAKIYWG